MKHVSTLLLFLLVTLMVILPQEVTAQAQDFSTKFGVQFSGALPLTEFGLNNGIKGSYLSRAYARFCLTPMWQLEVGAGYGSLAGMDFKRKYYRTQVIPIDVRLLLNLIEDEDVSPYLYAGIGALSYNVTQLPTSVSRKSVDKDGFTGVVPVGAGIEFALSQTIILDVSTGVNYSLTDNLNYHRDGTPTDAYLSGGIGFSFVTGSGTADDDHDGLTNKEEKELGTDPKKADTDGDGLSDGDEIHKYHTNPLKVDTDGDGLSDGDEVLKYHTDPLKVDTDGDGLNDGDEVMKYHTDPLKKDTDGDGLNDSDELLKYHTDPLKMDTDGDGLSDGDEVNKYNTDPRKADSDGGSVNDGQEIANGTNPLDPSDDIPKKQQELKTEVGVPIVLEGIYFRTGSAEIGSESEDVLMQAFNTLDRHPEIEVVVQGHTDNVGKHQKNVELSKRRAEAVKSWLVKKGVAAARIETEGFGPDKPVASNATTFGKQKNRRIEFMRIK